MSKTGALLALGLWILHQQAAAAAQARPETFNFDPFDAARQHSDSIRELVGKYWPFKKSPAPSSAGIVRIVSWNIQAFGSRVKPARKQAAEAALSRIFEDPATKVFAAQELANQTGVETLGAMLPGGDRRWAMSFENSGDSQDNGFLTRKEVRVDCEGFLFADQAKSRHPARMAHMHIGDFDFTMVTLHLAYDGGRAESSVAELRHALEWLKEYLSKPGADPDVILAGDFNLPTRRGKASSARARESGWTALEDVLGEFPLRLVPLVDERTSRYKGAAANNYDHFIITRDLLEEEYVPGSAARFPVEILEAVEGGKGAQVSDHYPISALFRQSGQGNDSKPIRLDGNGACKR